jgi:hypothetical protein
MSVSGGKGYRGVGASRVRYHYVCAWHGTVASAAVRRNVPAAASYQCPVCGSSTETWVGANPPDDGTSASVIDMPLKRAG